MSRLLVGGVVSRILLTTFILLGSTACSSIISRAAGESYNYYYGSQLIVENFHPLEKPLSALLLVDLPLSLVADTLLLPVDFVAGPYCGFLTSTESKYRSASCQ